MIGKYVSAATRISLVLVGFSVMLLLLAQLLGLVPDRSQALLEGRKQLCEAIAVDWSLVVQTGNFEIIRQSARALVERNPDVLSVALRSAKGKLLAVAGDHDANWKEFSENGRSTPTHAVVPLYRGSDKNTWGRIEFCFRPLDHGLLLSFMGIPILGACVFVGLAGFALYRVYMKKTLQHLDPSSVVPERVRLALDIMSEGVLLMDSQGRIVLANLVFSEMMGIPPEELQGQRIEGLPWSKTDDVETPGEYPWTETLREGTTHRGVSVQLSTPSDENRKLMVNVTPIRGGHGEPLRGGLATFDDVTTIEQRNAQLREMLGLLKQSREEVDRQNKELTYLVARDPLTNCLNRRAFFENAETAWNAAKRYEYNLGCLMIDIDHFKAVNDNHGHAVGDQVLEAVARTLRLEARDSDIVCRYGGEEFCVLLMHTDTEQANVAAEHFREAIASQEHAVSVTVSIGVSSTELSAPDLQNLINQADAALYSAKGSGRDRVIKWHSTLGVTPAETEGAPDEEGDRETGFNVPMPIHAATALMAALSFRDITTAEHSRQVAEFCVSIAERLMPPSECFVLEVAGLVHDIGKLGVPDAILLKPGPLTEEEWKVMDHHSAMGVEITCAAFGNPKLTEIAQYHHTWFGGKAEEPTLPVGKDIPLGARILSIADAFSAMVCDRPYRKARSYEEAFEELRTCAGTQFDPELVELFVEVVTDRDDSRRKTSVEMTNETMLGIGKEIERFAAALDARELSELGSLAHHLKAVADKNSMSRLAELALDIERAATDENDLEKVMKLTTTLLESWHSEHKNHLAEITTS